MKRLVLVRHGKSSWKEDLPDDQRPLKKRGYKDADLVISAFQNFGNISPLIWSSYATRALTTAQIFKEKLGVNDSDFLVKDELYTFDRSELLRIISGCDDAVETLMIFGHNPAITGAVNFLGDQVFDNIPTTGLTVLEFQTDSWKHLSDGKTVLYLFPKNLR